MRPQTTMRPRANVSGSCAPAACGGLVRQWAVTDGNYDPETERGARPKSVLDVHHLGPLT